MIWLWLMKPSHLKRCQVETPPDVVELVWTLVRQMRVGEVFESVLDLGAGDGRFSWAQGAYGRYIGIERDPQKAVNAKLPSGAEIIVADAFSVSRAEHDLCIGNPPYIRHHGLDPVWRDRAIRSLLRNGGPSMKKTANAFVLFLAQALLKTRSDGLVAQVVPYEWVTRPSASELRDFISEKGWDVYVYRFDVDIFPTVLTTASITLIDKRGTQGRWTFGQIGRNGDIKRVAHPSGTRSRVLPYENADASLRAIRGLSPGGQDIFVLTEEQRLFYGLKKRRDVRPCIVSLRPLDPEADVLDDALFESEFVYAGRPCWLIRSDREKVSDELAAYLIAVGDRWERYSTCKTRKVWSRYRPHPVPAVLVASGFTGKAPKVLVNSVAAIAVGSVYGIVCEHAVPSPRKIATALRGFNFQRRLVHHANELKKLEVRQVNAVLAEFFPR